jgi:peptide-methionine (S)-S-oxide reductase
MAQEVAVLGGGCFWCLEAVYDQLKGVLSVESGYTGGHTVNPDYKSVCSGMTGHAEVVRVTFDNDIITYQDILDIFFVIHDPTTLNRQGADIGTQYRSEIFTTSEEQRQIAEATIARLTQEGVWKDPIVTAISPLGVFYMAEDYHQEYFVNNPLNGYCQAVVAPKVSKFRKAYFERLKA